MAAKDNEGRELGTGCGERSWVGLGFGVWGLGFGVRVSGFGFGGVYVRVSCSGVHSFFWVWGGGGGGGGSRGFRALGEYGLGSPEVVVFC